MTQRLASTKTSYKKVSNVASDHRTLLRSNKVFSKSEQLENAILKFLAAVYVSFKIINTVFHLHFSTRYNNFGLKTQDFFFSNSLTFQLKHIIFHIHSLTPHIPTVNCKYLFLCIDKLFKKKKANVLMKNHLKYNALIIKLPFVEKKGRKSFYLKIKKKKWESNELLIFCNI